LPFGGGNTGTDFSELHDINCFVSIVYARKSRLGAHWGSQKHGFWSPIPINFAVPTDRWHWFSGNDPCFPPVSAKNVAPKWKTLPDRSSVSDCYAKARKHRFYKDASLRDYIGKKMKNTEYALLKGIQNDSTASLCTDTLY